MKPVLRLALCLLLAPAAIDAQAMLPNINIDFAHVRAANDATRLSGLIRSGASIYETYNDFREANDALDPDDLAAEPDLDPAGSPRLPSRCLEEENAECIACYESAQHEIDFLRMNLERLRAIYAATKNYTGKAIAFGDSMAGLPGGFGMAWPEQRFGIQDEMKKLGRTYDRKYQQMIGNLEGSLRQLGECEERYFDTPDWYDRFGFIYYSFMADRYKRSD